MADEFEETELEPDEAEYGAAGEEEDEEEEEESPEQEERGRTRRGSEMPRVRVVHTNLIEDYLPGAVKKEDRRLSPFLSRYEMAELLKIRAGEIAAMTEAQLVEDVGFPPAVLDELVESNRRRILNHLQAQLRRKIAAVSQTSFDDLTIFATLDQSSLCEGPKFDSRTAAEAAQKCAKPRLEAEITNLTKAIGMIERGEQKSVSPLEVARVEWHWRRTVGYGMPYFLVRTKPDGRYEVWELWEMERLG